MSEITDSRNRPTGDSDTRVIRPGLEKTEYVQENWDGDIYVKFIYIYI